MSLKVSSSKQDLTLCVTDEVWFGIVSHLNLALLNMMNDGL